VRVVADDSVPNARNLVAGANRTGFHYVNANYGRDYSAELVADIALARGGDGCPSCPGTLVEDRGIEVGHIFKLGTFLSDKLNATFLDENGASQSAVMGCYGIGIGRLLAAVVEYGHDDKGIIWPIQVAPYHVHICTLNPDKDGVEGAGERLYQDLRSNGIDVLLDDRPASPGVKFNDADLIGIPLRITVSPRTLAKGSVEVKERSQTESELVPIENAADVVSGMVRQTLAAQGCTQG
jgi:prolyl-tRNA synthetase